MSLRKLLDYYPTPDDTVNLLLENHQLNKEGVIFEPSAGDGAFIRGLKRYGYENKLYANEIRKEEESNLDKSGADIITHHNFMHLNKPLDFVTTVITNPPYFLAKEFVEKAFTVCPNAEIIMLLRLDFLGSLGRKTLHQNNPLHRLIVLSKRPSFTGGGTDRYNYAYFVWNRQKQNQEILVL